MKSSQKIKNRKFDDIIGNIGYYSHLLNVNGFVGFKKVNATESQQQEFAIALGDRVKWIPNSHETFTPSARFVENYSISLEASKDQSWGELLIPWHIDQIDSPTPRVGVVWNNTIFSRSPRFGKTLFINMRKVYESVPSPDWKNFLDMVKWTSRATGVSKDLVEQHRLTGQKMLRFCPSFIGNFGLKNDESKTYFFTVEGRDASQQELDLLNEVSSWISDQIWHKDKFVESWEWGKGDLVAVDLSVMIHALTKGFKTGEREFIGYWCFPQTTNQ